jgi:translation initiation factor 5B
MPPKKKGNKKAQQDDWEADMGESIAPQDGTAEEPKAEEAPAEDEAAGGGLMAALQRRGKKKKHKAADFELEDEDPTVEAADGASTSLDSKAPQEATFDDDDDDVFAGNYGKKKGKGGGAKKKEEAQEEPTEPVGDAGRVKTKAEKEKEKKEKEKQRKKELVCVTHTPEAYRLVTIPITNTYPRRL